MQYTEQLKRMKKGHSRPLEGALSKCLSTMTCHNIVQTDKIHTIKTIIYAIKTMLNQY